MKTEIDMLRKYKIGVLAGGDSSERVISLKGGEAVLEALKSGGLDVVFVDAREDGFSSLIDRSGITAAFIVLHGRFGEGGTVQKILDEKNIPYTGSSSGSSALAIDKIASKKKFIEAGLNVPEYCVVTPRECIHPGCPCVVKPRYEGSSIGLSIVISEDDVRKAVEKALKFGNEVIVEKFISGREITVGILGQEALPVIEIVTARDIYDYDAKYESSDTRYVVPAELDGDIVRKIQKAGIKAYEVLGCEGFSRVDMRLTDTGEIYVLEVNTIPGLAERSLLPMAAKAAGLNFLQLCVKMLTGAVAEKDPRLEIRNPKIETNFNN